MVKSVEVKNFKSIADLKLELGRVNVFIGENGSGKSNILEAVAFGAAASANKLDKEFLASRGMRVPEPKLMRSAFSKDDLDKDVEITFKVDSTKEKQKSIEINYKLRNKNDEFSIWIDGYTAFADLMNALIIGFIESESGSEDEANARKAVEESMEGFDFNKIVQLKSVLSTAKQLIPNFNFLDFFNKNIDSVSEEARLSTEVLAHPILNKFKIYAPENTFLRKFEDENAGDPLGIRGEGLFKLLNYFQNHDDKSNINTVNETLSALDWFDSFEIPSGLYAGERRLNIVDRFLDPEVSISQNSANEGFLFILFYISLFVSPDTPPFFAIDNLDASFNPKLCKHITRVLTKTAKDFNKQALFTTHNPFILDGLDLTDDEQRLFVVYRSQKGHTITKRILPNDRKMPLSEQWMSGLLGGLPENF